MIKYLYNGDGKGLYAPVNFRWFIERLMGGTELVGTHVSGGTIDVYHLEPQGITIWYATSQGQADVRVAGDIKKIGELETILSKEATKYKVN